MRSRRVIMLSPPGSDAAHLVEAVADLPVQQFVSQVGNEALDASVFEPRYTGSSRLIAPTCLHSAGDKLRTIVRPNVVGSPVFDELVGQIVDHVR